jgi:DNA-binding XRE family transcriptional regulator
MMDAEMEQDVRDFDAAREDIEQGEELVPSEVVYAILDGENPVRVWREYRGFTQDELANAAGISLPYLVQIEADVRKGTVKVLEAIAKAMDLDLDDLVFEAREEQ